MSEKLNKLQIRAKVLEIVKSYKSENDINSNSHDYNVKLLSDLNEDKFVAEILLKELVSTDKIELMAVKALLADFASLELVEESIWNILKDKTIPDKQKEKYLNLLRFMGGKIDISLLMDCMEDLNSVVDEQTQELLQLAAVNPEAQIDFLDFLCSLKPKEQMQLINSLQEDFQGDEMANILVPCLSLSLDNAVKEIIIPILGKSNSYIAVKPLKKFIEANVDNELKKLALKALNQLSSSGVEIDNNEILTLREKEVCKNSVFYKAYLSQVDGCGNQGLIFSRISDNQQITMFSTVINISDGILDCFGLRNIPIRDFQKVITRFKENDLVVPVSAGAAKYILSSAEKTDKGNKHSTPYEYICWSVYLADIEEEEINYNELIRDESFEYNSSFYRKIYDTEFADSWFFEYDDNIHSQELINYAIDIASEDTNDVFNKIEAKIDEIYPRIFTPDKVEIYSDMLKRVGYIFYMNNNWDLASMAVSLSYAIQKDETAFLKDVLRRSILQYLANIIADDENEPSTIFNQGDKKPTLPEDLAFLLLNGLEERWDKNYV